VCSLFFGCDKSPVLSQELRGLPPPLTNYAERLTRTKLPHIAVTPVRGSTQPWESKLLGVPYYPKDRPWPTDVDGQPLVLLAQLNFSEMPHLDGYPSQGILQFYISPLSNDTQIWGMRIDAVHKTELGRLTDQSYFRVVYFPEVSQQTSPLITESPPIECDEDCGFPVTEEARLRFAPASSFVRPDDYRFERVFAKTREQVFDSRSPSLEDEYMTFNGGWRYNGRVGGYSRVEQEDPRLQFPNEDWIVLFSLDSLSVDGYGVLWGDDGIGNFYIRPSDLAKLDFSKVMYSWDSG
jgi:uncharacterized protein YwqG